MKNNLLISLTFFLISCGIIGLNFKVRNPRKSGSPQKFDREQILLGELNKFRSCYDVHYYDFVLTVEPEDQFLSGTVQMFAHAVTDFDTIQMDLDQPFEIMELTEIETGKQLKYTRDERTIYIPLKHQQGESFGVEISYQGHPMEAKKAPWKGGFVWDKDENKQPFIGVACESDGASIWWPLKDHTSDEPDSMRMHYTVPEGLVAVGNGQLERDYHEGGKQTFDWFVSYPINTYNVTIYVGDYRLVEDEYFGIDGSRLKMSHYVLPENERKAKIHFQQLHSILTTFEKIFGKYPWYRDGFKLVESPYAGMEHQTAIAYGNGYKNDLDNVDYIILHETAHEWWGNSVTATDLADVWLQEGFATYAEALYVEDRGGYNDYEEHLLWTRVMIKNKYPVVGPRDRRCFHFRKNSDVYGKGAWILHSLRSQIENDDLFFEIIQSFYAKYAYGLAKSTDFIRLVHEKTGIDYQWFFDQYLYINEAPSLEYNVYGKYFYFRWANVPDAFQPVKLDLIQENNDTIPFYPTTQLDSLKVTDDPNEYSFEIGLNLLYEFKKNRKLGKH